MKYRLDNRKGLGTLRDKSDALDVQIPVGDAGLHALRLERALALDVHR